MTDVDRQIERSAATLERVRTRVGDLAPGSRRRREAEVLRRLGRIALADLVILVGALLVGWFVPLGTGGALLVVALLALATALFAIFPVARAPRAEALATAPIAALPAQTARWLEAQRPALPAPARSLAENIGVRLDTLAPQLATLDEREPVAAEARKLVAELPELIRSYERVPGTLRGVERNGRTPDQQLVEALRVLDEEIGDLSRQLAQGDLDRFETRGRYLEIKYQGEG